MATMSPLASRYARVVYLRDDFGRPDLVRQIIPIAVDAGWPSYKGVIRAEGRLIQLINLALEEERNDRARCGVCNGVGRIGIHVCEKCRGAGVRRPTLISRARALNLTAPGFKKSYLRDYENIVLPIVTYLGMELSLLRSKLG